MSENKLVIKKIYPLISELDSIKSNIPCDEEGCDKVFKTLANLTMHLQKHHKKLNLPKSDDCIKHYHCPNDSCLYNNKLHFTKIKYVKQHFLKVHADRKFMCKKCNKGFSTESVMSKHTEICGISFNCSGCENTYASYEALLTHARRKKHTIQNKSAFIHKYIAPKTQQLSNVHKNTLILPKQTITMIPVIMHVKNDRLLVDKQVQTEPKSRSEFKKRSTQQTQTISRKKPRISTETQTTGDCIVKRAIQESKIHKSEMKKCTKTQTKNWEKNLDNDINFRFLTNNQLNIFEDSSCNSQTQTDVIFQDEFLQSQVNHDALDLSVNMYTQTCDDLLSELEFTNIQTQTNWPDYDMFVSTETQTLLTHNTKSVLDLALNAREITHMETQTDMEFKQLLEEINA